MDLEVAIKAWADHADKVEAHNGRMERMLARPEPLRKNLGVANVPSAATTQTLVLGGPSSGRMWFVHRVGILGTDGHTGVGGAVVDVYTGPGQDADASAQIYSGLLIPTIIVEGRHHNPVLYGERLYMIAYSLPANQQLQFVAGIEDYPAETQLSMRLQ